MKKKVIIFSVVLCFIAVMVLISLRFVEKKDVATMNYPIFIEAVENNEVAKVIIKNEEQLNIILKNQETFNVPNPLRTDLKEFLLLKGIEVQYKSVTDLTRVFSSLFVMILILGIILYMKKGTGETKQLIRDFNKKGVHRENIIKFVNVAGNYEAKDMVKDIIDFIKQPEKYKEIGAKMPRGILLYGLPGTGKTLLAKAIAGEANVPFFAMSGSDFVQMYVGVGANRVRELFKSARKSEKAVIFIDEIDALGKSRSGNKGAANDEREQTLNALLTEMSGFNSTEGIVVIGATNRADTLDPALLRPGRFDRQIEVALPDKEAREEIIKLYMKEKPISEDVDIHQLSKQTVMFSGAMLENLVNEGAIIAANEGCTIITKDHFENAFYTVVAGMSKKNSNNTVSEDEKLITAYHEAGHALVTKLLLPDMEVAKVTIIPTTKGVAGYNYNITKDKMYRKKGEIIGSIKVLLGGRAAEELAFGEDNVTTGAMNDIKEASKELYQFYSTYGMDEDNKLFYLDTGVGIPESTYEKCSEKMKDLYLETKQLLTYNGDILDKITALLMQKETIDGQDIDGIMQMVAAIDK
ncbi:MAG: cell division protein FtsH [Firmicutes bacterium HGW-Firmicutes-1]|nr:MAG: cell division protein FtsH [Firmicutes bacterium HGW-Firmicutes-1]